MKDIGRIIAFAATLLVLVVAGVSVVTFMRRSSPAEQGISFGLCGLSSVDDVLIGTYLDSKAEELSQPAGTDDTPTPFIIEPGETAADVAINLEDEGFVVEAELFRRYVQYHGLDANMEAGEYTLSRTMTIPEIANALQRGLKPEQLVTIQEGLRLEQIAASVAEQTTIPEDDFYTLVTTGWQDLEDTYAFLSDLPPEANLEGFLFPETYRLPEEATAVDLVNRMLSTFDQRVSPDLRTSAADQGLSLYEMITLASIVEREALLDEERPLIAGVYHNRLDDGWYLSACPTVQYALSNPDNWWPALSLEDLELESPYNTYKNLGLPPGPICSPGLSSIQASANPAETEYFFFLADCTKNDGSHLFAVTSEEHNNNYVMCGGGVQ